MYKLILGIGGTKTNLELMRAVDTPYNPKTGKPYNLHHINQDKDGTLAIIDDTVHKKLSKVLHDVNKPGVHNPNSSNYDPNWNEKRKAFWRAYATLVS